MEPAQRPAEEVQSHPPQAEPPTSAAGQAIGEIRPDPSSSLPLYRFSVEAQAILAAATEQARRLGHAEIRPEHLLLAFMFDPGASTIRQMLRTAGVDGPEMERLRVVLVERLRSAEAARDGSLMLSEGCKQILQVALTEALRPTRPVRPAVAPVDPTHLLMGLILEGSALHGSQITARLAIRGMRVAFGAGRLGRRAAGARTPPEPTRPPLPLVQRGIEVATGAPTWAPTMTRANVVTFRISDDELAAVDALVESGAMRSRSEASGWLLHAGIVAQQDFFNQIRALSDEIARLRQEVQRLADERIGRRRSSGNTAEPGPVPDPTQ